MAICSEHRVLPFPADFRTKVTQISLCDDRKCLASGCIKHGVFESRRSNRLTVVPHRLSTTRKEKIFSRSAVLCANSSGYIYVTPPYKASCIFVGSGAFCGLIRMNLVG